MIDYAWHDFVGNLGVACILGTYFALQAGRLKHDDVRYSVINGLGAMLIMVSLYFDFNLSSFIIECFWLLISGYGLLRQVILKRAS